ncbi:MAG: hypothetical protein ACJASV_002388 [Pseudorhodobacter sp.]|jgi:hypothetical protein
MLVLLPPNHTEIAPTNGANHAVEAFSLSAVIYSLWLQMYCG